MSFLFRDPAAWQELVADEALIGLSDEGAERSDAEQLFRIFERVRGQTEVLAESEAGQRSTDVLADALLVK